MKAYISPKSNQIFNSLLNFIDINFNVSEEKQAEYLAFLKIGITQEQPPLPELCLGEIIILSLMFSPEMPFKDFQKSKMDVFALYSTHQTMLENKSFVEILDDYMIQMTHLCNLGILGMIDSKFFLASSACPAISVPLMCVASIATPESNESEAEPKSKKRKKNIPKLTGASKDEFLLLNKLSVRKSRERKNQEQADMEAKINILESENKALEKEYLSLKLESKKLKKLCRSTVNFSKQPAVNSLSRARFFNTAPTRVPTRKKQLGTGQLVAESTHETETRTSARHAAKL